MTSTVQRGDRLSFILLLPSLVVPIAAIAAAAWGTQHVDDGYNMPEVGLGLFYFAAMMTLSATLFSMTLNVALVVRRHASVSRRAIPWRRTATHYLVALVVVAWSVYFTLVRMQLEGLGFGVALVCLSVLSYVLIVSGAPSPRESRREVLLTRLSRSLLAAHPVIVAVVSVATAVALVNESDASLVGLAILAVLGLPLSGATGLLWFPLFVMVASLGGRAVWWEFFVLAVLPAIANSVLSIVFLVSARTRSDFLNDVLDRAGAPANTLSE